jgi:hypothetical protein
MAGGGGCTLHRGGRGDARASCASPLGTPLLLNDTKFVTTVKKFQCFLAPSGSAELEGRNECGHGAPDRQPTMYSNLKIAWTLIDNFQRNPDLGYKVSSTNILMLAGPYGTTKVPMLPCSLWQC